MGHAKMASMEFDSVLLLAVAVGVGLMNTLATRRLWNSAIFEPSQKVAQTILIWVIPGSFIVVWAFLREPRVEPGIGGRSDPRVGGLAVSAINWLAGTSSDGGGYPGGGHHEGTGGSHQAAFDGGGHHGGFGGQGGSGGDGSSGGDGAGGSGG
jgi:hypothetical protein